ncbi:phage terminase small subunit P27 family [Mongoliimonas terrestris]|uniref:phage terminase small subunit P27 family n=1 Tax=Mongoliimonas terrestris TaxID=1709001 RepID=UPI00094985CF|nr:phage terminase small subunit P27 family [Mongoliimonas terrestris]
MRGERPHQIVDGGASTFTTVPKPPAWLSKDAKAEWKRVAPILVNERKVLTVADLVCFQNYCLAAGEVAEASRIIAAEGLTIGGKKHPAVTIRKDAMNQARLLANELGLTPVSRSRAPMREAADDGLSDALGL